MSLVAGTAPILGPAAAPALHVMTFNIRRRVEPALLRADRWSRRRPLLERLLATERPTLLGVQEARPDQADVVRAALGPAYRVIGRGHGREWRGEGCPILFDSERLELRSWQQTALSDHPDEPGSMTWGNRVPRILVLASFRDRATSADFTMLNTHLDHLSGRSRLRSIAEIRGRLGALASPVVLTGDFNAGVGSPEYRGLFGGGRLSDAWVAASCRVTPEWGTLAHYRGPREYGRRIDWIGVTPGVEVDAVGINADPVDGGWPSDHLPVQASVILPAPTS